jgi:predicted nucleic acid-binding protein
MSGRYFLDTNILVYSLDPSAPEKCSVAERMVRQAIDKKNAVISYQVAQEFLHVALTKFRSKFHPADLEQFYLTVLRPLMAVHPSTTLFMEALHVHYKYKISWYDSLIVAAALEAQCGVLYSEDLQHGMKIENLTIKNPFL